MLWRKSKLKKLTYAYFQQAKGKSEPSPSAIMLSMAKSAFSHDSWFIQDKPRVNEHIGASKKEF